VAVHTTAATESDIPALADVHTQIAANHATPGEGYVIASRALHEIQARNRAQQNNPDSNHRYDRRAGIEGTI
jgi:hypothetical protein